MKLAQTLGHNIVAVILLLVQLFLDGAITFKNMIRNAFMVAYTFTIYQVLNGVRITGLRKAKYGQYVPVTFVVMEPAAIGLGDIIKAGLGFLFVGIFSIVILAVLGQFAAISSIWPAANVTKITTNVANSVVTGSAFLSILVVLIMVGFVFVVIGLLQSLIA